MKNNAKMKRYWEGIRYFKIDGTILHMTEKKVRMLICLCFWGKLSKADQS